jgi:hypothetical protein
VPTTLIDNGKGLAIIESVKDFFQHKNDEKNLRILDNKFEIPIDENFSKQKESIKIEI